MTNKNVYVNLACFDVQLLLLKRERDRETERERIHVLFNDALNTFYLWLYGIRHMVKDHSVNEREETRCRYSFRLAARVLLYV